MEERGTCVGTAPFQLSSSSLSPFEALVERPVALPFMVLRSTSVALSTLADIMTAGAAFGMTRQRTASWAVAGAKQQEPRWSRRAFGLARWSSCGACCSQECSRPGYGIPENKGFHAAFSFSFRYSQPVGVTVSFFTRSSPDLRLQSSRLLMKPLSARNWISRRTLSLMP